MWRPPSTREPGPRRKPGAFNIRARIELVSAVQLRAASRAKAIPAGLSSKSFKIAEVFFIHAFVHSQFAAPCSHALYGDVPAPKPLLSQCIIPLVQSQARCLSSSIQDYEHH